jgi:hypothetical protein
LKSGTVLIETTPPPAFPHNEDAFDRADRGEIDEVECSSSIRLCFRNSVEENANAARCAGIGAIARTARTETADVESDVACTVSRLCENSRYCGDCFVERVPTLVLELLFVYDRYRERR